MKKLKMTKNDTNGILITFCGLDGCGKTTIINRLLDELRNEYPVFLTKQPTDFVRNSSIFRTYMDCPDHSEFDYRSLSLLAASDRVQHNKKIIDNHLRQGKIVLCDRYFYSCLANLRARGYKHDKWIYEISKFVIKPDLAFFFDVSVETAVGRVRSREDEKDRYINMELQYKLSNEYKKICEKNNGILVSTEISEDESYKRVKEYVRKAIEKNEYL
ncbi:MAG: dTMP kinase [Acutalibacteraceae bacterium]